MNAKPILRRDDEIDETHNLKTQPQSSSPEELGQDIFVEGDPALTNWAKKACHSQSLNVNVDADLKTEKLTYINQMLVELRKLSLTMDEPMVAYLIEMALLETDTALNVGEFRDGVSDKVESTL